MSNFVEHIKKEILFFEQKALQYDDDAKPDIVGITEFFKGKAEVYRYAALRLKRLLDFYEL